MTNVFPLARYVPINKNGDDGCANIRHYDGLVALGNFDHGDHLSLLG